MLYNCYVRSKLEYASLVWTPHYDAHVNQLESVQRKFLKLIYLRKKGIYPAVGLPQEELLSRYYLLALSRRRECLCQVFLLKILNNSIVAPQILSFCFFFLFVFIDLLFNVYFAIVVIIIVNLSTFNILILTKYCVYTY